MIDILIVDDSPEKAAQIKAALCAGVVVHPAVVTCGDIVSAKRELRARHFDALILDIQIPVRAGNTANPLGGKELLDEILVSSLLHRPRYVVGVTEFEEALQGAGYTFAQNLFSLIDTRQTDWEDKLRAFSAHVVAAEQLRRDPKAENGYRSSMAIVCALHDPEQKALLKLPLGWRDITGTSCNPTFECELSNSSGTHRLISTSALEMGMPAAAALAAKSVERWRPRFLAMTGIAAGIKGDSDYGDVIIADTCWDYSGGKVVEQAGEVYYQSEPRTADLEPTVKAQFMTLCSDEMLFKQISMSYPEALPPKTPPKATIGPMFTGTHVVTSKLRTRELAGMHRKLRAIDMEGYAVFAAAKYAELPRPLAVVVKSVSDFADPKKNDKWRPYASHTSAAILMEWAKRFL